ncbi:MAG: hypothetical protein HOM11_05975 [Methylococcales bacterium]|jgi:hypothetical protein|nr:hypothetical protein [Methylococcales bacterium]
MVDTHKVLRVDEALAKRIKILTSFQKRKQQDLLNEFIKDGLEKYADDMNKISEMFNPALFRAVKSRKTHDRVYLK